MVKSRSMISSLRRHFESGVSYLDEYLKTRQWRVDWSKIDLPDERDALTAMLQSYIVVHTSGADRYSVWNDPSEPFMDFLNRQKRPHGVTCATTDLYAGSWYVLDRAIGRNAVVELLRTCSILKPGSDGPHGAWIQVAGKDISSVVRWPPARSASAKSRSSIGLSDVLYSHLSRDQFKKSKEQGITGFAIDTVTAPVRCKSLDRMLLRVAERCRKTRRTPWIKPSSKTKTTGRTPAHEVALTLYSALRRILPHQLIGGQNNWNLLRTALMKLTRLRKGEVLESEQIVQGMRTKDVPWLQDTPRPELHQQYLKSILLWLFQNVVISLLAHQFYITETSFDPSGLYYYRHLEWRKLEKKGFEELRAQISENKPVTSTPLEITSSPSLPSNLPSQISPQSSGPKENSPFNVVVRPRFVPKARGVRAILNLRGLRDELKLSHMIMSRAWDRDPTSLNHPLDFIPRVTEFADRWQQTSFFFVKADVSACFDNADTDKLLQILETQLREEDCIARTLRVVSLKKAAYARVTERGDACWANDAPASNSAPFGPSTVVIEKRGDFVRGAEVLETLKALLKTLKVRVGTNQNSIITRTNGISQGSTTSLDLCNILLDHLVQSKLNLQSDNTLLMRYVDDFLFISTNIEPAREFLDTISVGFPDYGVSFNPDKIQTNVENPLAGFQFLGQAVSDNLQVMPRQSIRPCNYSDKLETACRRLRYDLNFASNILRLSGNPKNPRLAKLRRSVVTAMGVMAANRLNYCGVNRRVQKQVLREIVLRMVAKRLRRSLCRSFERAQRQFDTCGV